MPVVGNACRGRGSVSSAGVHCVCESGFAGSICDPVVSISSQPYGMLSRGSFCPHESKHCPDHPVFNLSSIAVIDLQLPPDQFLGLLDPCNKEMGWVKDVVNVTFIQGSSVVSVTGGSMKLGGSYSKRIANKGWILKEGDFGAGVTKLKTKSGVNDMTFINSLLVTDMYRAMGVPVPLVSAAQLFINGVSHGLAMLYQEPGPDFLKSQFGSSKGNLYKCDAQLLFRGFNQSDYDGVGFEQESGNGDWSDLIEFLSAIHQGNLSYVESVFDIDGFLRLQAVESVFADGDGFACSGHNYFLYFDEEGKVRMARHDLDDSFGLKSNDSPCKTKAVSYWAQLNLTNWGISVCGNALSQLILSREKYRASFAAWCNVLIAGVAGDSDVWATPLGARINQFYTLFAPVLVDDRLFSIDQQDCGGYDAWFALKQTQFADYVRERVKTMAF